MGEKGRNVTRVNSTWSGRFLAAGGTGFALGVALLMVLSPVSAGAGVHPAVSLVAPYKGTVSSPNSYSSFNGCAVLKSGTTKWAATTGMVTSTSSAGAKTCAKSLGSVGAYSSAYGSTGVSVGIPFKVGSNGNHSIGSSFTVTLATTQTFTSTPCKLNVNYAPALYQYSYGYCEDGASNYFDLSVSVVDLNNASWYSQNYSYAYAYNNSYTENYSDCYNYGTPTCYNSNGTHSYGYSYGYNDPGFAAFAWNGATSFSMWTNATMMVKTHHYALIISISTSTDAFAEKYNVIGAWTGSASDSINMGTLGNGAKLNSVTIV